MHRVVKYTSKVVQLLQPLRFSLNTSNQAYAVTSSTYQHGHSRYKFLTWTETL